MTLGPPEKENTNGTKAFRWMIGAGAAIVATPIITTTIGSFRAIRIPLEPPVMRANLPLNDIAFASISIQVRAALQSQRGLVIVVVANQWSTEDCEV